MRFVTEFEITEKDKEHDNWMEYLLAKQKYNCQTDMGTMIANLFGWQNPVHGNDLHFRVEIEAFQMDKWVEFKQKLFMECGMPEPNGVAILEMIKELEFYGDEQKLPG